MRVEPVAAIRRRGDEADRLVILPVDIFRLAVLPRRHAVAARPGVGVALALEANEDRRRHVRVRLRIAPGLVLADEAVEHVVRHAGLDALVAGRAAVIEIKVGVHDVGNEIRLAHGQPAQRIADDVVIGLEEILPAVEARREGDRTIENPVGVAIEVHHVRRRRGDQDQRRARRRIDDAVIGVERDREHRAALPFEGERFRLPVGPDFGGAAAFDHDHDLLVHVLFGIERAGGRHLDHVAAPAAFGAEKLDERALAAHALPRLERHVLHALDADAAEDRNVLRLHEIVVRRVRPLPGADACVLEAFRLVPMIAFDFVHFCSFGFGGRAVRGVFAATQCASQVKSHAHHKCVTHG